MTEYVDRSLRSERGGGTTKPGNADILDKRLDALICFFGGLADTLERALEPVLLPERPEKERIDSVAEERVGMTPSPLFSGLFSQASALDRVAVRFKNLIDRIDL